MNIDFEPSGAELMRAIGAAFIAMGSTLPPSYSRATADRLSDLARQMADDGDTRVGTLCRALAESFAVVAEEAGH